MRIKCERETVWIHQKNSHSATLAGQVLPETQKIAERLLSLSAPRRSDPIMEVSLPTHTNATP